MFRRLTFTSKRISRNNSGNTIFKIREEANENMYIHEQEKQKMLKILHEIKIKDLEKDKNDKTYTRLEKIIKDDITENENVKTEKDIITVLEKIDKDS